MENIQRTQLKRFFLLILSYGMVMKCIRFQIPQLKTRRKKLNGVLLEVSISTVCQIYYCTSSLRNHSLFLIPHFELRNLSPTIEVGPLTSAKNKSQVNKKAEEAWQIFSVLH